MSVEDYDTWVIRYGSVFLVAMAYEDTKMFRFSESVYDALQIENKNQAAIIADRTGGECLKFNPITGRVGVQ